MPRMSKVRIVNFSYNDGNRLIADELFDFSNQDGKTACNTLFNLANGGGKSVLVQLMLQPMVPKAKAAGRRIEDFFTRLGDHSYVVIEWLKDNSPEKLLTGISMAAQEATASDDGESRGFSVKYYTFCANYTEPDGKHDIVGLPLSERKGGKFVPAGYDAVKKLENKSGGVLKCYSSDEAQKWRTMLKNQGIYQAEWQLIATLNSEEGGLGKYFGNFKTSKQLMDKLLIKTIEDTLREQDSHERNSLAEILLDYTGQYSKHQDRIQEQACYAEYAKRLKELFHEASELCTANDKWEESVLKLLGFSHALEKRENKCEEEIAAGQDRLFGLEEEETRITWEERSSFFYQAQDNFEAAKRQNDLAAAEEDSLRKSLEAVEHESNVLACAERYEQLKKVQAEIEELEREISRREQEDDSGKKLAVLKYSTRCSVQDELSRKKPELERIRGEIEALQHTLKERKVRLRQERAEEERKSRSCSQAEGRLAHAREETDRVLQPLGMDRRLDNYYSDRELRQMEDRQKAKRCDIQNELEQVRREQERVASELEQIPQKVEQVKREIEKIREEETAFKRALEQYQEDEKALAAICQRHTLDFDLRFTSYIADSLERQRKEKEARQSACKREQSEIEAQMDAVKSGTLHVPKDVLDCLSRAGVRYQSCEKYLLFQVEKGLLPRERCLEILKKYPSVAYGIVMDEEEGKRLLESGERHWLPVMSPLFTYAHMNEILRADRENNDAIAFYAEDYFREPDTYAGHLREKWSALENRLHMLNAEIETLKGEWETACGFTSQYTASWNEEQKKALARREEQIKKCEANRSALERQGTAFKKERDNLSEQDKRLTEALYQADGIMRKLDEARTRMENERDLEGQVREKKAAWEEARQVRSATENEIRNLEDSERERSEDARELESLVGELKQVWERVQGCQKTEVEPGAWRVLLHRYETLSESISKETEVLHQQRDRASKEKRKLERKISSFGLPLAEYELVTYSEDRAKALQEQKSALESRKNAASQRLGTTREQLGRAEQAFQTEEKNLKGRGFAEPLEKPEIGSNFEERRKSVKDNIQACKACIKTYEDLKGKLDRIKDAVMARLPSVIPTGSVPEISLEEDDCKGQSEQLCKDLSDCRESLEKQQENVRQLLGDCKREFENRTPRMWDILAAISDMRKTFSGHGEGDRYSTLAKQMEESIKVTDMVIRQIEVELKDLSNRRNDLILQCVRQGRLIYDGLCRMSAWSAVKVYEGRPPKRMLRFDLPETMDDSVAKQFITLWIDDEVERLAKMMSGGEVPQEKLEASARQIIGSEILLCKFLGKDAIEVEAFKIDQNPHNAGYRTWKQTRINNSGAEKFVVYFSVILSLMNYTRGDVEGPQNRDLYSVIILDNPFGATSSKHILEPMFSIAKHFRVQMICLSDIDKSDVISEFETVIKAVVKKRPLSKHEILTHEGNERIEHGFYHTEMKQLSFS